jgi:hypothetical protein
MGRLFFHNSGSRSLSQIGLSQCICGLFSQSLPEVAPSHLIEATKMGRDSTGTVVVIMAARHMVFRHRVVENCHHPPPPPANLCPRLRLGLGPSPVGGQCISLPRSSKKTASSTLKGWMLKANQVFKREKGMVSSTLDAWVPHSKMV